MEWYIAVMDHINIWVIKTLKNYTHTQFREKERNCLHWKRWLRPKVCLNFSIELVIVICRNIKMMNGYIKWSLNHMRMSIVKEWNNSIASYYLQFQWQLLLRIRTLLTLANMHTVNLFKNFQHIFHQIVCDAREQSVKFKLAAMIFRQTGYSQSLWLVAFYCAGEWQNIWNWHCKVLNIPTKHHTVQN